MIILPMPTGPILIPTGSPQGNPMDLVPKKVTTLTGNIFRYAVGLSFIGLTLCIDLVFGIMMYNMVSNAWYKAYILPGFIGLILLCTSLLQTLFFGALGLAFMVVPIYKRSKSRRVFLTPLAITLRWALAMPIAALAVWLAITAADYTLWGAEGLYMFKKDWFYLQKYAFSTSWGIMVGFAALHLTLATLRLLYPRKRV